MLCYVMFCYVLLLHVILYYIPFYYIIMYYIYIIILNIYCRYYNMFFLYDMRQYHMIQCVI